MAFSQRFAAAKPKPQMPPSTQAELDEEGAATGEAAAPAEEDSDEIRSVGGNDGGGLEGSAAAAAAAQREEEEQREMARREIERKRAVEQAEAMRRRQAAAAASLDARRRAEEDERARREYEAEKARQETIARSKRDAAKRAMGSGGGGGGAPPGGTFAWKKSTATAAPFLGKDAKLGTDPRLANLPRHDECEQAIAAMIQRSVSGMKEGLSALGLPNFPLVFVPGQELRLCGRNMREEINAMIHAWMTDEKDVFYNCLLQIKSIVATPLLTEEEFEMVDDKAQWVKTTSPEGVPVYTRRDAKQQAEDDDDEVIDVTPSGVRVTPGGVPGVPAANAQAGVAASPAASLALSMEEDYYELLGVDTQASLHEIRTKFRALVVAEHPEKGGDVKKFQKFNKAYSILSDTTRRKEYDELRAGGAGRGDLAGLPAKKFVD